MTVSESDNKRFNWLYKDTLETFYYVLVPINQINIVKVNDKTHLAQTWKLEYNFL